MSADMQSPRLMILSREDGNEIPLADAKAAYERIEALMDEYGLKGIFAVPRAEASRAAAALPRALSERVRSLKS